MVTRARKHPAFPGPAYSCCGKVHRHSRYLCAADSETLRGFQAIVDGEMDQYPEAAFYNVGTIDDVVEKAKKLEAGEL